MDPAWFCETRRRTRSCPELRFVPFRCWKCTLTARNNSPCKRFPLPRPETRCPSLTRLLRDGADDDDALAWKMTDQLVREAQAKFFPTWEKTKGDNGYVSFELDSLLEDVERNLPVAERTKRYDGDDPDHARDHRADLWLPQ